MLCSYSREDYISSFAKGSKKGALLYLLLYPFLYLVSLPLFLSDACQETALEKALPPCT